MGSTPNWKDRKRLSMKQPSKEKSKWSWFSLVFVKMACNILDLGGLGILGYCCCWVVSQFVWRRCWKEQQEKEKHSYFLFVESNLLRPPNVLFNEMLATRFKKFWLLEFICMSLLTLHLHMSTVFVFFIFKTYAHDKTTLFILF